MTILQAVHDLFVPHARNDYKPHALRHRHLSLYAGLMLSLKLTTLFSLGALPQNQAFSSGVTTANIIELTNSSRSGFGLSSLKENPALDLAAQKKAEDMVANQYFAHTSPQGRTPWDFIKDQNYNYLVAGENLAVNFQSAEGVEEAWMNSPGHKANILNKDFKDIGIGIAEGDFKGAKALFVVQMFGTISEQPYISKKSYTKPAPLAVKTISAHYVLPDQKKVALEKPVVIYDGPVVTTNTEINLSGEAEGAKAVYVLINNIPQAELPVVNGKFSGLVSGLAEGDNAITVVSFNNALDQGGKSDPFTIKVDTGAPQILSSDIKPFQGSEPGYVLEVKISGDPVKLVASAGENGILLSPTADPQTWEGVITKENRDIFGNVNITAYDLAGNVAASSLGSISNSTISNYGFLAEHKAKVQILGRNLPLNGIKSFYLYFALILLVLLAIMVAIQPRIQHLTLIAHTSAAIMIAMIFWIT
jgi:uncharacterized protein YkwD